MSLLPPNPIVQSKCYYYLKKNLEPSLFEEVTKRLPPFPKFRLKCVFRSIEAVETIDFSESDIIDFISQFHSAGGETEDYSKVNLWDCSDIALNMFVRMKKPAIEKMGDKKGVLSFMIQSSELRGAGDRRSVEEGEDEEHWSDIYLDEVILRKKDNNLP
jgi:hypothetical protein